jgi:hypothetical protein
VQDYETEEAAKAQQGAFEPSANERDTNPRPLSALTTLSGASSTMPVINYGHGVQLYCSLADNALCVCVCVRVRAVREMLETCRTDPAISYGHPTLITFLRRRVSLRH